MSLKTIILDFDGVIVESVGIKDQAFHEIYKDYPDHYEKIMAYHYAHNATIRFEKFKYISEQIIGEPLTDTKKAELEKRFSDLVHEKIVKSDFVPGAIDFLEYFHRHVPLYLVSISPTKELAATLAKRKLHHYFERVFSHPWKKVAAFSEILKQEKATPEEAVFIGDTPEDCLAARTTDIPFIGRQTNKTFEADTLVYDNMLEIKNHIVTNIIKPT